MSTLPTELFGYRVVAKLGSGAASELYAVQDPKTTQVWALKHVVRHDEKGARFIEQVEQEHAIGSKLDHPNVRGVSKVHRTRKLFTTTEIGLLLELVDADAMDQRMPRNMLEAVDQFRQIADGLAHMHERGFVHADMKPINAMVCASGNVKIIDLGQACAIGTKKKRVSGEKSKRTKQKHQEARIASLKATNSTKEQIKTEEQKEKRNFKFAGICTRSKRRTADI